MLNKYSIISNEGSIIMNKKNNKLNKTTINAIKEANKKNHINGPFNTIEELKAALMK